MKTKNRKENHLGSWGVSRREFLKLAGVSTTVLLPGSINANEINTSLALINGSSVDSAGRSPVSDGVLVIDGMRIVNSGTRSLVKIPSNSKIIDVRAERFCRV